MKNQTSEIRIYVACLAAYNNGILHGCWINADQDAWQIWDEVNAMLKASPIDEVAEEWAIHDYEGFEGVTISEWDGFERVAEIAAFIAEHGALGGKLIEYFGSLKDAQDAISDQYAGEYRSTADFVQEMTEQGTEIPESLQYYIDWNAMARDWEINDILTIETGFEAVHVFWRA
jgi:antirestriction protein